MLDWVNEARQIAVSAGYANNIPVVSRASRLILACFVGVGSRYSEAEIKEALTAYQLESGPIFSMKWRTP
jgi:hypothetical protein